MWWPWKQTAALKSSKVERHGREATMLLSSRVSAVAIGMKPVRTTDEHNLSIDAPTEVF
uniref:Uncharacterized protein n=1 Tax=Arion vulgaris TaxID=1028688 RepID=A0A0B7BFU8_9EUPU